jgi:hypothetical protein
MAQGTLVDNQVDDGKRLMEQLASTGFDVAAAFWVRTGEDGEWILYIASKVFEEKGPAAAYRAVNDALRKLDEPSLSMSDIKVIGANNPITSDVHKIQKRYSGRMPVRFGGARFGGVEIEEAYIYSPVPSSAGMKKLQLKDKVVDEGTFHQLTSDLQRKQPGTALSAGHTKVYDGKVELHDPVIEYDETKVSEADVEKIAKSHGFEKR